MISPVTLSTSLPSQPAPAATPVAGDVVQIGGGTPAAVVNRAAMAELFRSRASSAHELWRTQLPGGNVKAPPAVGPDGTLYCVTDKGVTAIGPDGTRKWTTPLKGLQGYATPLLDGDGNLHLSGGNGAPGYSVLGPDGKLLRQQDHGYAQVPPIHGPEKTIYFGSYDGVVRRLEADGSERWKYDIGSHVNGEMGVGKDGSVYAVGDPGILWAIRPDGSLKWKFDAEWGESIQTGAGVCVTPENEILAVNWNSHLRCMDADGNTVWQYGAFTEKRLDTLTPEEQKDAVDAGNTGLGSTPVLSHDKKTIYVGGSDGTLHAVTRDGHKIWTARVGDGMGDHGVQVGADGTIYTAGEHDATLHAVSPDGHVLWSYESDKKSNYAYIATHGDNVYLVTHEGHLTALSSKALQQRVEEALQKPDGPPPTIELGDGHIVINGVRVPKRR